MPSRPSALRHSTTFPKAKGSFPITLEGDQEAEDRIKAFAASAAWRRIRRNRHNEPIGNLRIYDRRGRQWRPAGGTAGCNGGSGVIVVEEFY